MQIFNNFNLKTLYYKLLFRCQIFTSLNSAICFCEKTEKTEDPARFDLREPRLPPDARFEPADEAAAGVAAGAGVAASEGASEAASEAPPSSLVFFFLTFFFSSAYN